MSHGKHEGHRDVSEKSSKVNTDIGESKEGDGGDEINLKYVIYDFFFSSKSSLYDGTCDLTIMSLTKFFLWKCYSENKRYWKQITNKLLLFYSFTYSIKSAEKKEKVVKYFLNFLSH